MSGVVVKVTENKLIVTKEDKKVRITVPYADYHYDATFASDAETLAGTETTKAVSPASLEAVKDVEGGLASKAYADAKVSDAIVNGVTGIAPSQNAVFDALALKADIAPITTYTHTANKEARCTAVDISTNVFTSNAHPLINGDMVWAIVNEDAGAVIPLNIYPGGITHMGYPAYYVGVVDANSFKLYTDSARTTEVDITTNANMDLSKMHFETRQDEIKITNLNAYKYRVVVNGKSLRKDATGGTIGINNAWTGGVIGNNNLGNNVSAYLGNSGDVFFEGVFDLDSTKTARIKIHTHTITTNNSVFTASTRDILYLKQSIYNTPITSILFNYCYFANGTKIEVYKA